ncbi:MAG: hypothetical protein ABEJ75_04450 [Candidatus Nanohaloarchaea archaeon]
MPIKKSLEGGTPTYRLQAGGEEIVVDIGRDKKDVAYFRSADFDFLELAKKHSGDGTANEIGLKNAFEELGIEMEDARVVGVFSDEISVLLDSGSRLVAGGRWGEETQLFP